MAVSMVDDFRDWIDGDDVVTSTEHFLTEDGRAQVSVTFEDGTALNIDIAEAS